MGAYTLLYVNKLWLQGGRSCGSCGYTYADGVQFDLEATFGWKEEEEGLRGD